MGSPSLLEGHVPCTYCLYGFQPDLLQSRGCLACFSKPPLVVAMDDPSKGLRNQGQRTKRPKTAADFWSTSTHEMDNAAVQSQRSASSISTSNHTLDSAGSSSTEFVNHGLLLWNQTRQLWIGNKSNQNHVQQREPILRSNVGYESLLGSNKPFPQPIPLPEMIEFLVDIWEQDGLYD